MADEHKDEPKAQSSTEVYLQRIARDIQSIKSELSKAINFMHDAESEVPEKMRRFIMYFHDVHDLVNFYHELGQEPPHYIKSEAERCADRFRHLVEDLNQPGEIFEKVRREMANRPGNRYDHTKLLSKETPSASEGNQQQQRPEAGAEAKSS